MSSTLKLVSYRDASRPISFAADFSQASIQLRAPEFRAGGLPPEAALRFLDLPIPSEFWLAYDADHLVGRIGANVPTTITDTGFIGFFEIDVAHPRAEDAARSLLEASARWLAGRGAKRAVGPLNINTWFPYRFMTGATDEHRYAWEPLNPEAYPRYFEKAGFKTFETYRSEGYAGSESLAEACKPAFEAAVAAGFTCRPFDVEKLLEKEVPILHAISMEAFKSANLFEPVPVDVFRELYVPLAKKADLGLAQYIVSPTGEDAGFFFAFEDRRQIVFKTIAVRNSYRGQGLSNALMYHVLKKASDERGLKAWVAALVRAGAQSESYGKKEPRSWQHEYRLYERAI